MSVRRAALVISPPAGQQTPKLRLVSADEGAPGIEFGSPGRFAPVQKPGTRDSQRQHFFALNTRRGRVLKRLLDLSLAIPVVVFSLPVLCLVVKIVQLFQSSGPLFYCQTRCGREGREFTIVKFRTMDLPPAGRTDLEENPGARIYPLGKILRRSKLDEIPQFINVLLGSMSVVGPRPHHFDDCRKFEKMVGDYSLRTVTKPGITGLAQYTEYRGDFEWNSVENRVAKDLAYIHNWTMVLDLLLILKTAAIVCRAVIGGVLRRMGISSSRAKLSPATLKINAAHAKADDMEQTVIYGKETQRRAA